MSIVNQGEQVSRPELPRDRSLALEQKINQVNVVIGDLYVHNEINMEDRDDFDFVVSAAVLQLLGSDMSEEQRQKLEDKVKNYQDKVVWPQYRDKMVIDQSA